MNLRLCKLPWLLEGLLIGGDIVPSEWWISSVKQIPVIEKLENSMLEVLRQRAELLMERRRQDVKDEAEEVNNNSELTCLWFPPPLIPSFTHPILHSCPPPLTLSSTLLSAQPPATTWLQCNSRLDRCVQWNARAGGGGEGQRGSMGTNQAVWPPHTMKGSLLMMNCWRQTD